MQPPGCFCTKGLMKLVLICRQLVRLGCLQSQLLRRGTPLQPLVRVGSLLLQQPHNRPQWSCRRLSLCLMQDHPRTRRPLRGGAVD